MLRNVAILLLVTASACAPAPAVEDDDGTSSEAGSGGSGSVGTGGAAQGGASAASTSGQGGASSSSGGGDTTGIDPSNGMGGLITPGMTGTTPLGAIIRMPAGYDPTRFASPVMWLFNETLPQWSAIADQANLVLVDLDEYNDTEAIGAKLDESIAILEAEYNVDKARYYWAGWSAGGNIVVIFAAQNQALVAGTLVFPGTGGNYAKPAMEQNAGHKIRLYYACGDQDPNYDYNAVEYEAGYWQSLGYTTRFDLVAGAPHAIDETTYGVRAAGWDWIEGFNLQN